MSETSERRAVVTEEYIHFFFDVTLWIKALFALSEIAAGFAAYFISKEFLVGFVQWVTANEFAEDPHDAVATYLMHTVQGISVGAQDFAAIYLLAHGVVKLWLIVGLLRKKLWYYPTAIIVFGLFIVYQLYRYAFTHSALLIILTVLDAIVIGLTWHEYNYLRSHLMGREQAKTGTADVVQ